MQWAWCYNYSLFNQESVKNKLFLDKKNKGYFLLNRTESIRRMAVDDFFKNSLCFTGGPSKLGWLDEWLTFASNLRTFHLSFFLQGPQCEPLVTLLFKRVIFF